mmetsp:Transcript_23786/g.42803  ORF Transcript_23786/g.42803 Transcript_23786/m.42803 type:complete len:268 (-) Transcript_23786:2134-2937(-)
MWFRRLVFCHERQPHSAAGQAEVRDLHDLFQLFADHHSHVPVDGPICDAVGHVDGAVQGGRELFGSPAWGRGDGGCGGLCGLWRDMRLVAGNRRNDEPRGLAGVEAIRLFGRVFDGNTGGWRDIGHLDPTFGHPGDLCDHHRAKHRQAVFGRVHSRHSGGPRIRYHHLDLCAAVPEIGGHAAPGADGRTVEGAGDDMASAGDLWPCCRRHLCGLVHADRRGGDWRCGHWHRGICGRQPGLARAGRGADRNSQDNGDDLFHRAWGGIL